MRPGLRFLTVIGVLTLALAGRGRAQISPGPLARPHAALEGGLKCLSCHPVGRKEVMDAACQDCHREIAWLKTNRRGLHTKEANGQCAQCHPDHAGTNFQLVGWTTDSVARFDHRRAGYALDGAHREVKCESCHRQANRVGEATRLAPAGAKPVWWTGLDTDCASCHEEVHRDRIEGGCEDCHTAEAWAPAPRFDHARTEYPLTGRHQDVACRECHTSSPDPLAAARGALDPAFETLRFAECSSCHRDPHQGRLGVRCTDCHVTKGFAEPIAGGFDHSRTRYPLEGRHRSVNCVACHRTSNRRPSPNPEFGTCAVCHRDAHDEAATVRERVRDCAACHGLSGFTLSSFTLAEHNRSSCVDCHVQAHANQLGQRARADGCQACHLVTEWGSSTFSTEQHREFALPLDGRHGKVTCRACHGPDRADLPALAPIDSIGLAGVQFRFGTATCVSCHTDPHQDPFPNACTDCHDASGFRPSTMDLASHATLGFRLAGAHRATPCVACHEELGRPTSGASLLEATLQPAPLQLHTERADCAACHQDPHEGQFVVREGGRCDRCHGEDQFVPADRFDHDADAAFSLKGAHRSTPCNECHAGTTEGDTTRVRYRPTPKTCEGCHAAKPPTLAHGRTG